MKIPRYAPGGMVILQALIFYAVMLPLAEMAQAAGVGASIRRTVGGYSTVPSLINYIAYIAGFVVCVIGLLKLKAHIDNPERTPLSHALWHLFGAGLLISLPFVMGLMVRTLGTSGAASSTQQASSINLDTGGPLALDKMLIRLVADIRGPMGLLIWTLGVVLGFFFMTTGLLRMARGAAQDGPRGSLGAGTITRIIIGSILFSTAATADLFTNTLFGGNVVRFSGMQIDGMDQATIARANQAFSAILIFIQIIGFIAFMRGFLMVRALADGNNSVSTAAAFTHIIGGAVAFNISPALRALEVTMCQGACGTASWFR